MLSIFRTNQFFANIILLFYAVILRFSVYIVDQDVILGKGGLLSDGLNTWIGQGNWLSHTIALILVVFQAVYLNVIITQQRMASEISLFPGVFYILIASCIPDFLYLSPPLIGASFIIIATNELLKTYKQYSCADNIFNVGFWVGVASLFYFSYIIFILVGWVGLNILRAFKIKERLALLLGLFAPYFLVYTYYFWYDRTAYFWATQFGDATAFWDLVAQEPIWVYIKLGIFLVFILIALFSFRSYMYRKNIRVQKNISIIYWLLLFSAATLFIQANISTTHLFVSVVPLGILISFNFIDLSSRWAEMWHFILLVAILVFQFFPFAANYT